MSGHLRGLTEHDPAPRVLALDGLRFTAASLVATAHYYQWIVFPQEGESSLGELLAASSGMGMTLFFVLSGFVIHYNYRNAWKEQSGVFNFAVARFSRLYPLYIVLFAIDFFRAYQFGLGSCGREGLPEENWIALPLYLTLTQDWFYSVVCQNSLIFQYGQISQVSWSISLEAFLYICYIGAARWIVRWPSTQLIMVAAAAYAALIIYLAACQRWDSGIEAFALQRFGPIGTTSHGYQDSFLRWLMYFNPAVHVVEFLGGVAAAALFLSRSPLPNRFGNAATLISLILAIAIHIWLYGYIAPTNGAIGRTASSLYQPIIVIFVFLVAACPYSTISRIFSFPFIVALGESSYSIYLLHAFFWGVPRRLFFLGIHPWLLWALSLGAVFLISRMSYAYFERPAQKILRRTIGRSESQSAARLS